MAKTETKSLTTRTDADILAKGSDEGVLASENAAKDFFDLGFSEEKTIKIGDPEQGSVEKYIGELVGPGLAVELSEMDPETGEVKTVPTWIFHPLNTATMEVNTSITHRVLSPFQLNAAFARMHAHAVASGKRCIGGAWFVGKVGIMGGKRMLNNYRIFDKYVDPGAKIV